MTKKLFYSDPKIHEWTASITNSHQVNGKWYITLDQTAFYPEGGGQPADLGFIDKFEVLDVIKNEDEVLHILKEKPKKTSVRCKIDKYRRIEHTQHHSGQHLLSAVCLDLYNAETVSFHLSPDTATIDLNVPDLSDDKLTVIEKTVNDYILENRKINVFHIDKSELEKYNLRKIPSGIEQQLRIVEIDSVEYNACAGTPVQSTSEIGLLKLLKTERMKGNVRLHFICGIRLLKDYNQKDQLISALTSSLTTGQDLLVQQVEKLKVSLKEKERNYNALFDEYSDHLATKLIEEQSNKIVVKIFPSMTTKELSIFSAKLLNKGAAITILGSESENKIILSQNGKTNFHCGKVIKENAQRFSGKGGGSPKTAQALFQDTKNLRDFFVFVSQYLQDLHGVTK